MKKYLVWLWRNTTGIRLNMLVRILAGFGRVAFGLTMIFITHRPTVCSLCLESKA